MNKNIKSNKITNNNLYNGYDTKKFRNTADIGPKNKAKLNKIRTKNAAINIQQQFRKWVSNRKEARSKQQGQPMIQPEDSYLKSLMFPETAISARIPSRYPVQSAVFHKHFTLKSTTNASGNLCFLYCPNALWDTNNVYTSFCINNNVGLDLVTNGNTPYTPIAMNYSIPPNTYSDYRLVSASVKIIVNTPTINSTGIIGGGIVALPESVINLIPMTTAATYPLGGALTVQSNMDTAMYFKQADVSKKEDLRMIYYPFDSSYEQFIDINKVRPNATGSAVSEFYFCGYVSAAAASTNVTFEVDLNYECLVYPLAKGYIPTSVSKDYSDVGRNVRVLTIDPGHITQAGTDLNTVIMKEESSFIDRLLNAGSFLGKTALKILPEVIKMLV